MPKGSRRTADEALIVALACGATAGILPGGRGTVTPGAISGSEPCCANAGTAAKIATGTSASVKISDIRIAVRFTFSTRMRHGTVAGRTNGLRIFPYRA